MTLGRFPFAQAARWLVDGSMIPFLGAGSSIAGIDDARALPSGRALAVALGSQIPAPEGGGGWGEDWSEWELAKVAQLYEAELDRSGLYEALTDTFCGDAGHTPARMPTLLARIPSRGRLFMVTTNYDEQIEEAFAREGRDLAVVTQLPKNAARSVTQVQVTLPNQAPELHKSKNLDVAGAVDENVAILYKMHGSPGATAADERDSLVITEDDYVDFMLGAGPQTAAHLPPPELMAAFQRRRFLFLGYSLEDWNFRTFLRLLTTRRALASGPDLRHWAVQRDPTPADVRLWHQRQVTIHRDDLAAFADVLDLHLTGLRP